MCVCVFVCVIKEPDQKEDNAGVCVVVKGPDQQEEKAGVCVSVCMVMAELCSGQRVL